MLMRDELDPLEFAGWWQFANVDDYRRFRDSPELQAKLARLGEMLDRIGEKVMRLAAVPYASRTAEP